MYIIPIHFIPNEPQVLSLKETSGCMDGFNVLYELSDGRTLQLPRPAAIKLNILEPQPGEEFTATKHQTGKEPVEWVFALTAKSEQIRAEREAEALAEKTRRDLPGQLTASVLRQMPKSARRATQDPPEAPRGTETYGPVPQVALAGRKTRPEAVPFNVAFVEVTRFVVDGLKEVGEQWNDQAKQDAICSVLISASRQGLLTLWERGGVE